MKNSLFKRYVKGVKCDWEIYQVGIWITLYDKTSDEAYDIAKGFGINVDKQWFQFWKDTPTITMRLK